MAQAGRQADDAREIKFPVRASVGTANLRMMGIIGPATSVLNAKKATTVHFLISNSDGF